MKIFLKESSVVSLQKQLLHIIIWLFQYIYLFTTLYVTLADFPGTLTA